MVSVSALDSASSRRLGQSKNGADYYAAQTLAKDLSAKQTRLAMVAADEQWTSGCSENLSVRASVSSLGQEATLSSFEQPDSSQCTGEQEFVGEYLQLQPYRRGQE